MTAIAALVSIADARHIVLSAAVPVSATERVTLARAHGRVLARDVLASADVPPFDRAAMDGYAVMADDTEGATREGPRELRVVGSFYTGERPSAAVTRGECTAIATGAPLPEGADAVVMVEETTTAGGKTVAVLSPVRRGQHVGARASDLTAGEVVVRAGELLTPARVGALAAAGAAAIDVYVRPAVAILPTGNEIVAPGEPLGPGQIHDINGFTLAAIVEQHGGTPHVMPPAADDRTALASALDRAAAAADIVVLSGGSSVGDRDLVVDVLHARGEVLFHGISIKPGKPTAFGRAGGKPVLGMPGNPTSCLTNAYLLLVPLLRAAARLPAHQPRILRLPLGRRIASTAARHQFYTVRIEGDSVVPAFKGSGEITSMSRADGYIEIPAGVASVEPGAAVDVTLF